MNDDVQYDEKEEAMASSSSLAEWPFSLAQSQIHACRLQFKFFKGNSFNSMQRAAGLQPCTFTTGLMSTTSAYRCMSDGTEHRICANKGLNLFTHKHVHDPGSGNLSEYISVKS